jgi:SAM-dependent methyltransferase
MDTHAYEEMAENQDHHWWFKARREIISQEISKLGLQADARILEIGCGPGGNIGMLQKHGQVCAMEMDKFAREFAASKTNICISEGWLPDNLPFNDEKFDLICMFDVLEHVREDKEALQVIRKLLKPGGALLITVPAYQWLFGKHDETLHHHRRYILSDLSRSLVQAGYKPVRKTYFNSLLFPLVMLTRMVDLITRPRESIGSDMPGNFLNQLLYRFFRLERRLLKRGSIPFGTSILVIAR